MSEVLATDSSGTLVHVTSRLVGIGELLEEEAPDAVLVVDKSRSHDGKRMVNGPQQQNLQRRVLCPQGCYDSIDEAGRFNVRRVQVKPKASFRLQKNRRRAGNCLFVKGSAEITCGNKKLLLTENQSTHIPLGEVRHLLSLRTILLEIIEVQSGCYPGGALIKPSKNSLGRRKSWSRK